MSRSDEESNTPQHDADIDACYARWLMEQPDAQITGGDKLTERMEQQWGWDDFMRHFTGAAE